MDRWRDEQTDRDGQMERWTDRQRRTEGEMDRETEIDSNVFIMDS